MEPELLSVLMGISVAAAMPQVGLLKRLIARGLMSKEEAIGIYDELLNNLQFSPDMSALLRPIWTSTIELIRKQED